MDSGGDGELLMQRAKKADREFTQTQQQSRPQDLLTNDTLYAQLEEVREAYSSALLGAPNLAHSRGAEARLWSLHSRSIDELQKRLRAAAAEHAKAAGGAPPPDALLYRQKQLTATIESALVFYDGLLGRLAPAVATAASRSARVLGNAATPAAAAAAAAMAAAAEEEEAVREVRGAAMPHAHRVIASHVCLCGGDLRRYLATLPYAAGGARSQRAAESRHRYRLAAALAPTHGRPHNCLGVLASAPQLPQDPLEAVYRYARALACNSPYDARSNLRNQLERLRRGPAGTHAAAGGATPPPLPSSAGVAPKDLLAWGAYLASLASLLHLVLGRRAAPPRSIRRLD